MREETLNPMQEAIAFGRVIPGAAAEFTNEPRAEEFYSDAFSEPDCGVLAQSFRIKGRRGTGFRVKPQMKQ